MRKVADVTSEAQKIWKALRPMIDEEIKQKTNSCVRARKMRVMSAPENGLVGVAEPFGNTVHVPYSSQLADLQVGDAVWVYWYFNNASTMIAMSMGNGQSVRHPYAMITKALTYCSLSNGANAVLLQEAYLSEVIPGAHKQIKTLNVQMGETDITRTVWDRVTRTINIPSVEENLLITGEAVQFETGALTNRTVRIIIDYGTLDSSTIEIPGGGNYATMLSAPSGYVIDSVSVTMGSTDITDTAYDSQTSTVYIPDVSQNVTIYVSCDDA